MLENIISAPIVTSSQEAVSIDTAIPSNLFHELLNQLFVYTHQQNLLLFKIEHSTLAYNTYLLLHIGKIWTAILVSIGIYRK